MTLIVSFFTFLFGGFAALVRLIWGLGKRHDRKVARSMYEQQQRK